MILTYCCYHAQSPDRGLQHHPRPYLRSMSRQLNSRAELCILLLFSLNKYCAGCQVSLYGSPYFSLAIQNS